MKKNLLTLFILCFSSILFLFGCAEKKESSKNDDGNITLRISWWGGDDRHQATLSAIKEFEKKNPNIKVKAEYSGFDGMLEKMTTQIAGKTEPDIMQLNYDWYTQFSKKGNGFYNLNKLDKEFDLSNYDKKILKSGNIEGKQNGIPFGENIFAVGINKSIYDSLGLSSPSTWDDFIKDAEKFGKGEYPLAAVRFYFVHTYLSQKLGYGMIDSKGNMKYTVKDLKEGLAWYKNMQDKKAVVPQSEMTENIGKGLVANSKQFIEGKYAGATDWVSNMSAYGQALKEKNQVFQIITMPKVKNAKSSGAMVKPSMLFSISKNTKHPKEAAKLLNFMLNNPDGIKLMGTARGIPSNKKALKILKKEGKIDDLATQSIEYSKETNGIILSPYFEMSKINDIYQRTTESFLLGEISEGDAAKTIYKGVKDELKIAKK